MEKLTKYRHLSKFFFIFSILISFSISILIYVYTIPTEYDVTAYVIPISIGLALYSISLAFDSNVKMIENTNERFLKIAVDFVEARSRAIFDFSRFEKKNSRFEKKNVRLKIVGHFLWWSKIHLVRANELNRKFIKSENQKYFYKYFRITIWQIFDGFKIKWDDLRQTDRDFIIDMYSRVREFDRNPGEERKLMKHFEQHLGKYPVESEENFYRRLKGLELVPEVEYLVIFGFKLFSRIKIDARWNWKN